MSIKFGLWWLVFLLTFIPHLPIFKTKDINVILVCQKLKLTIQLHLLLRTLKIAKVKLPKIVTITFNSIHIKLLFVRNSHFVYCSTVAIISEFTVHQQKEQH